MCFTKRWTQVFEQRHTDSTVESSVTEEGAFLIKTWTSAYERKEIAKSKWRAKTRTLLKFTAYQWKRDTFAQQISYVPMKTVGTKRGFLE